MVFYNFCYYFWSQHRCWTETSIIGNDFCVFYKFALPSTFSLPSPALPLFQRPLLYSREVNNETFSTSQIILSNLLLLPAICSIHACDDLPPLPEALLVAFWLMRVLPRCACHVPGKSHSVMCSFWYAVSTVLVWFNGLPTVSTVLCCDWCNDFSGALSFCDVCVLVRVLFWDSQCRVVQFPCRFVLLLINEALSSLRAGSSELASQAGLFVARLAQDSYGTAD